MNIIYLCPEKCPKSTHKKEGAMPFLRSKKYAWPQAFPRRTDVANALRILNKEGGNAVFFHRKNMLGPRLFRAALMSRMRCESSIKEGGNAVFFHRKNMLGPRLLPVA